MRAETVAFERAAAVRDAARLWRKAGAIDLRTEEAIGSEYADPRLRPSAVWQVLTFLFVTVIVFGVLFALAVSGVRGALGAAFVCFLVGGACVAATELQEHSPRFALRGGAGATALWACVLLVAGAGLFFLEFGAIRGEPGTIVLLAVSTVVWGAASWRWGNPAFALFSMVSLLLLLGRQPFGRLFWLTLGFVLAGLAWRHLDEPSWPPPHRMSVAVLFVASLATLYVAVNYGSVESWWIERLRPGFAWTDPSRAGLVVSMIATALMPVVLLAWGIRTRRLLLIDTGAIFLILSVVTLRHYVHIASLWAILGIAGAVFLVLALVLERWLSHGPGRERSGFTAEPLFSDEMRARLLQAIPVAATLSPSAPEAPEKGFAPGGGSFGGGGASDRF